MIISLKIFHRDMSASDTYTVAILALGEGWHNYHHVRRNKFHNIRVFNDFLKYLRCFHGIIKHQNHQSIGLIQQLSSLTSVHC